MYRKVISFTLAILLAIVLINQLSSPRALVLAHDRVITNPSLSTTELFDEYDETQSAGCTRNLLVNGNFVQDWPTGWTRAYGDVEKGGSITEVIGRPNTRILHMKHTGESDVSLYQIVPVPKGRMFFQFQIKFNTWEGPIMGFTGTGVASISLLLLDADKRTMGSVWAGSYVHNPFEGTGLVGVPEGPHDSSSASFVETPNGQTIRERFDVTRFVRDRLGRVNLEKIEYVAVVISVGATHPSAGAEAWVGDLALEVCPS